MRKENSYIKDTLPDTTDAVSTKPIGNDKLSRSYVKKMGKGLVRKWSAALLAVVLVLLVIISPVTAKASAESAASPVDTYQALEKKNMEKQIDALTEFYGSYLNAYNKSASGIGAEASIKVEFNSGIANLLGLKELRSIKESVVAMQTDKKASSAVSLFANDKEITSLKVLTDIENELYYLLIPELSKAYLKFSTNSGSNDMYGSAVPFTSKDVMDFLNNNPLTEHLLNQLLNRYFDVAVSELKDVSVTDYNTGAGGLNEEQIRYTVNIDDKTMLNIADKVLAAAKKDIQLQNLAVNLKIGTKAEYNAMINAAIKQVSFQKELVSEYGSEDMLVMRVWADKDGNITGRDFSAAETPDNSVIGYKTIHSGSVTGIDAWFAPYEDEEVRVSGKIDKDENGKNGNLTVTYENNYAESSQKFDVVLKDVKTEVYDNTSYINGEIDITGDSLPGSIVFNFTGDRTTQVIKAAYVQGTQNLVTVTIDSKVLPYEDFDFPSNSDTVYDLETQMGDYLEDADVENYLNGINSRIDIEDINNLIEQMLNAYLGY